MKFREEFPRSRIEREDITNTAFLKAEEVLSRDAIKVSDFRGKYDAGRIAAAEAYEAKCRADFEKRNRNLTDVERQAMKRGRILEAVVHENGERNNWFGQTAHTVKTANYDDYRHKVDSVLVLKEPTGTTHMALAIDVVSNQNVGAKLAGIFDEASAGTLTRVEYFREETLKDQESDFIGELQNIPRVLVGAEAATVQELAEIWVEGKNSALANHPVQFQILEQIILQCNAFASVARGRHKAMAADKYEQAGRVFTRILEERKATIKDSGKRDGVLAAIARAVMNYSRES